MPDAARHDVRLAVRVDPDQLDPEVAGPGPAGAARAVAHQPQQLTALPAGRGHPRLVAVEHERQQHLHRLALARAVGAAQQQPPVGEVEDLLVVLPDVEHAGAVSAGSGAGRAPSEQPLGVGRPAAA